MYYNFRNFWGNFRNFFGNPFFNSWNNLKMLIDEYSNRKFVLLKLLFNKLIASLNETKLELNLTLFNDKVLTLLQWYVNWQPFLLLKPETANFSMAAGDFLEVYKADEYEGHFDSVVTCFFIDCAHNILEFIELIHKILKPGKIQN